MRHSILSPFSRAWDRVLRTTHAMPSCFFFLLLVGCNVHGQILLQSSRKQLTPLAYPSAAASHMRDRPVGDNMDSLLSVMKFTIIPSVSEMALINCVYSTYMATTLDLHQLQRQLYSFHCVAAAQHCVLLRARSCMPYRLSSGHRKVSQH